MISMLDNHNNNNNECNGDKLTVQQIRLLNMLAHDEPITKITSEFSVKFVEYMLHHYVQVGIIPNPDEYDMVTVKQTEAHLINIGLTPATINSFVMCYDTIKNKYGLSISNIRLMSMIFDRPGQSGYYYHHMYPNNSLTVSNIYKNLNYLRYVQLIDGCNRINGLDKGRLKLLTQHCIRLYDDINTVYLKKLHHFINNNTG